MNLTFHTSIVREHEKFSKRGVTERIAPKRPSTVGLVCAPLLLLLLLLQQRRSRRRRRRRYAARRSLITITISRLNGRVFIQKPPRIEIDRACKIYINPSAFRFIYVYALHSIETQNSCELARLPWREFLYRIHLSEISTRRDIGTAAHSLTCVFVCLIICLRALRRVYDDESSLIVHRQ